MTYHIMGNIKIRIPKEFHQLSVELANVQRFFRDPITGSGPQDILADIFLNGFQPSESLGQSLFKHYENAGQSLQQAQEAYEKLGQFLVSLREKGIEVEF